MKNNASPLMWIFTLIAVVFTIAAAAVLLRGRVYLPPDIIMNPTQFDQAEQVGAVVFRRFWNEINSTKVVVVGASGYTRDYAQIWSGFLSVAKASHMNFSKIFVQDGLSSTFTNAEPLSWSSVENAQKTQDKILIFAINTEAFRREIEGHTSEGVHIYLSLLPTNPSERELLQRDCDLSIEQATGSTKKNKLSEKIISCRALKVFADNKLKRLDKNKIIAGIEKIADRDFILYVHAP